MAEPKCEIIAFYSYKGGVGRSLLAANVAATLALAGKNVLVIDWDLEAPGIGDFFDLDPKNQVPERWRRSLGMFDLFRACENNEELEPLLRDYLDPTRAKPEPALVTLELPRISNSSWTPGNLHLLGPGQRDDGTRFVETILYSNWVNFFSDRDNLGIALKNVLGELVSPPSLGHQLLDDKERPRYDYVILDTRTGLNLTTRFALTQLANKIVLVTVCSGQSLEGTHLLWKMLQHHWDEKKDRPSPDCCIALSRYKHSGSVEIAERLLDQTQDILKFPHLSGIADHEELFFVNKRLGERIFLENPKFEDASEEERAAEYRTSFWKLCHFVSGEDIYRTVSWANILRDMAYAHEVGNVRSRVSHLEEGECLIQQWVVRKVTESKDLVPDRKNDSQQAKIPEGDSALKIWMEGASVLDRYAVRAKALRLLQKEQLDPRVVVTEEDERTLQLQLWGGGVPVGAPSAGRLPEDLQRKAYHLWKEALRLRDRDDDPLKAAWTLRRAIKETEEAIQAASLQQAKEKVLREAQNDKVVYDWELAATLTYDWEESIRILNNAKQSVIAVNRKKDDTRIVSRLDLSKAIAQLATQWILHEPVKVQENEAVKTSIEEIEKHARSFEEKLWPEDELTTLIVRYRWLVAVRSAQRTDREFLNIDEDGLKSLCKPIDDGTVWTFDHTKAHSALGSISAFCVRACISEAHANGNVQTVLDQVRDDLVPVMASGDTNSTAQWLIQLAGVFRDCGRFKDAISLTQKARMIIAGLSVTGATALLNAEAIGLSALLDFSIGRPDRGGRSCENLFRFMSEKSIPAGSLRVDYLKSFSWWNSAAMCEMGKSNESEQRLTELAVYYQQEQILAEEERVHEQKNPGSNDRSIRAWCHTADRAAARRELAGIRSWLPLLNLSLGNFEKVLDEAASWEKDLRTIRYLDIGAERLFAICCHVQAMAHLGLNQFDMALDRIKLGRSRNAFGARAFGSIFLLIDTELAILKVEIETFSHRSVSSEDLYRSIMVLQDTGDAMLGSFGEVRKGRSERFYTTRVRVALGVAVASTIAAQGGDHPKAREFAKNVEEWLSFIPVISALDWVGKIRLLPKTLAWTALSKSAETEESRAEYNKMARESFSRLDQGHQKRYKRIFDSFNISAE